MRPALPGSRISETRETTDGSAELNFRIQFPPAESRANHRFLSLFPRSVIIAIVDSCNAAAFSMIDR